MILTVGPPRPLLLQKAITRLTILYASLVGIVSLNLLAFFQVQIQRGTGGPDPLENNKAKGFLRNTAPDHLENHKTMATYER